MVLPCDGKSGIGGTPRPPGSLSASPRSAAGQARPGQPGYKAKGVQYTWRSLTIERVKQIEGKLKNIILTNNWYFNCLS